MLFPCITNGNPATSAANNRSSYWRRMARDSDTIDGGRAPMRRARGGRAPASGGKNGRAAAAQRSGPGDRRAKRSVRRREGRMATLRWPKDL
jgi:hypothetical protein